jgi:DNA-binding transcriptional MocR family regulator
MEMLEEPNESAQIKATDERNEPGDSDFAITIGQTRASDLAERYLRSLIFSGRLVPGDKLPSERELAAQFGIARITLRAALRSLETVGFLVIKIGSKGGAWINDPATIRARWQDWMKAHHHELSPPLLERTNARCHNGTSVSTTLSRRRHITVT